MELLLAFVRFGSNMEEYGYKSVLKARFLHQIVSFLAIVAPPMDENGIAFGFLLKPSPTTCGFSVHGLSVFVK